MAVVRGTPQGLALTPARWGTWVAQRHEWNGFLWIRWSDAEAILLFVSGRPRIHLWDGSGWVESEHALTTVAQRLDRMPQPRWGQVPLPARWAAAIRDLSLVHPALPAEIVPPDAWLAWAQRQGFSGVAVLVGETAGAWVLQNGLVRSVRFHQGAVVTDDGMVPPQEGVLQIYRGRVALDLSPPLEPHPVAEFTPAPTAWTEPTPLAPEPPASAPPAAPPVADPSVEVPAAQAAVQASAPDAPQTPSGPPAPPAPAAEPAPSPSSTEIPTAPPPAAAAKISPPAPAESGENAVVPAGSEVARRFRGDERFLLAPTVDLASPEILADLTTKHGAEILRWLPLLDGSRTLEEVARAGSIPLGVVDAVVGGLVDRRLIFRRYTRPRATAPSQ